MRHKAIAVFAFFALALHGCAAPRQEPLKIQGVQADKFSKSYTILGAELHEELPYQISRAWFIRSLVEKATGASIHQIYVHFTYEGDWEGFDWVTDDTAKNLDLKKIEIINRTCFGKCTRQETLGVVLDGSFLRTRLTQGYELKFRAKHGAAIVIPVTPEQIRLQLAEIEKYQNLIASGTAPEMVPPPK